MMAHRGCQTGINVLGPPCFGLGGSTGGVESGVAGVQEFSSLLHAG